MATIRKTLEILVEEEETKDHFKKIIGNRSVPYLANLLNIVNKDDRLKKCDPQSVIMAAAAAASVDLPIDPGLGLAFLSPTQDKAGKWVAQFQIGWKGLVQLGLRTHEYHRINVDFVREGEFMSVDRMTGDFKFDWIQNNDEREQKPVIGVMAYFRLINGFEKCSYMTVAQLENHALTYSDDYKKGTGYWVEKKPEMQLKTTMKLLLEKWGPKTTEITMAIKSDQAVIGDFEAQSVEYVDNDNKKLTLEQQNQLKEEERWKAHIARAKTIQKLDQVYEHIPNEEIRELYEAKKKELLKPKK